MLSDPAADTGLYLDKNLQIACKLIYINMIAKNNNNNFKE